MCDTKGNSNSASVFSTPLTNNLWHTLHSSCFATPCVLHVDATSATVCKSWLAVILTASSASAWVVPIACSQATSE